MRTASIDQRDEAAEDAGPVEPAVPAPGSGVLSQLATLPPQIKEPMGLAALGLVVAAVLSFASVVAAVAIAVSALLLGAIALVRAPREAVGAVFESGRWVPVAAGPEGGATIGTSAGAGTDAGTDADAPAAPRPAITIAGRAAAAAEAGPPIEQLFFRHLYHWEDEHKIFGMQRQFRARYFLDLMEAALVPADLDVLTDHLAGAIKAGHDLHGVSAAIGPKRGNALLIAGTAGRLGLSPVLVKERPLFDRHAEGLYPRGATAVLLDDISSDGELLSSCVERGRALGLTIRDAFVIVDRVEGDARHALGQLGVRLHASYELSDDTFERITYQHRRGG